MQDPLGVGPQQKKANLSPLMVAKGRASLGEKVNFCPFGCGAEDLDVHGVCRHVVGFTNDGKTMEVLEEEQPGQRFRVVNGSKREPVRPTDKLVQITVSSRVYRDVDKGKKPVAA